MKNLKLRTIAALAVIGVVSASQAVTVAHWNFNDLTAGTPPSNANQTAYAPVTNTVGASLDLVGWTSRGGASSPFGINSFAGSTVNAVAPDTAGQALALEAGASSVSTSTPNNGAKAVFSFSTLGLKNVVLSFATRGTSTGFKSNQVAWSTDGTAYTDFGSAYAPVTTTAFETKTFDFSGVSALNDNATVFLRITFAGATGNNGNNRLDNIQLNAEAVPEPFTMALGASALALAVARRRRRSV